MERIYQVGDLKDGEGCKVKITHDPDAKLNTRVSIEYTAGDVNSEIYWGAKVAEIAGIIYGASLAGNGRKGETFHNYPGYEFGSKRYESSVTRVGIEFPEIKDLILALNALTKKREEKIDLSELEAAVPSR